MFLSRSRLLTTAVTSSALLGLTLAVGGSSGATTSDTVTETSASPTETADEKAVTEANHYVLAGGGVEGTVDTTSLSGEPVVSITVDGTPLDPAELNESEHGLEVTGIVEQVPDSHVVHFEMWLPRVNVAATPVPVSGLVTLTRVESPLAPHLLVGSLHSYEVRPVGGTAETVAF